MDILVDGHIVGRGGQVMAIPVSADEGHQAVSVQVGARSQNPYRNVQVRANQLLQLDVDLPMRWLAIRCGLIRGMRTGMSTKRGAR